MRTFNEILENLTNDQKQLLADTINYGSWGDCQEYFPGEEKAVWIYGYITDCAYKGGHFERRSLSNRFRSLFKALHLEGNKWCKSNSEMIWRYNWWGDGTGSVLFIREEMTDEIENWAAQMI